MYLLPAHREDGIRFLVTELTHPDKIVEDGVFSYTASLEKIKYKILKKACITCLEDLNSCGIDFLEFIPFEITIQDKDSEYKRAIEAYLKSDLNHSSAYWIYKLKIN